LWVSLKGEIVGEPHLDRYSYLHLEADVQAHSARDVGASMLCVLFVV
jgi:hypothetical protein